MPSSRYRLIDHPNFTEPLSREDLLVLVQRGSLGRGDICEGEHDGLSHTVGELIQGMGPGRKAEGGSRLVRPAYMEIRADGVRVEEMEADVDEGDEDEDEEDEGDEGDEEVGERLLFRGHPSWLCYWKGALLAVGLAVAGALLAPLGLKYAVLGWLVASAALLAVGLFRFSKDYLVTDERVEVIWGVIARSSKEVRIRDIRSIDVRENALTGLLGLGSVDFSSSANSGVEVVFAQVRGAHKVKELVRELQRVQDGGS
jgi:hypothetical protein